MATPSILIWLFVLLGIVLITLFILQLIKKRPFVRALPVLALGIVMLVLAFGVIS